MTIAFAILFFLAVVIAILLLHKNDKLKIWAQTSVAEAQKAADERINAMQRESQTSVAAAQKLIDQQFAEMQQEAGRIKQHYESESRKIQEAADSLVAKTIKDFEPLRKSEQFRDAEAEAQRQLADALNEATSLRSEVQSL